MKLLLKIKYSLHDLANALFYLVDLGAHDSAVISVDFLQVVVSELVHLIYEIVALAVVNFGPVHFPLPFHVISLYEL